MRRAGRLSGLKAPPRSPAASPVDVRRAMGQHRAHDPSRIPRRPAPRREASSGDPSAGMNRDRLTAFTDGVLAVIITIMVLEMRPPHGVGLQDLAALWPVFLSYVLSFVYIGIYWSNHHHFFHLVKAVDGAILWANMHLLFWLSTVPFATRWMGENYAAPVPTALYGLSLLMSAIAWYVMQWTIIRRQGADSPLARALGGDLKGKISPFIYLAGVAAAFVNPVISDLLYLGVALMWLIPDRRVETTLAGHGS
jgi:uncharacterized membrane protein